MKERRDKMMKILIAVDNQESGLQLAQYVIDHIGGAESEILIVHVIEPFAKLAYMAGFALPLLEEMERDAALSARVMVRNVALRLRDEYHSTRISEKVSFGHAPEVIVHEAEDFGADCIVVGCRRLKGLHKLIVSRVSTAVLGHATCPVLVVRDRHSDAYTEECKQSREYETSVTVYI
jgi:nucleotide-binding universal stress UspA family protein